MSKGIFVTGTGTDVGKTYVTALLAKKMREYGYDVGYYKAALSGANSIAESDAGYVNSIAQINQEESNISGNIIPKKRRSFKADSYRGGGIPGGSDDAEVQIAYRSSF